MKFYRTFFFAASSALAASWATICLTSCATTAHQAVDSITVTSALPSDPAGKSLRVIDAHLHTEFTGQIEKASGLMNSEAELLKEMQEAGVVGAVAHTQNYGKTGYVDLKSRNFVHCAGVTTRVDRKLLEAALRSGKMNCIKIYLGYDHQYASAPGYEPAYQLAEKYQVPVVFHTGDTEDPNGLVKYSDPLTVDEVAVAHRKVNFVLAHCGNPWIQSAAEVAYKNTNVYLDGSAMLVGNMSQLPREKVDEYVVKPLAWIFGYVEDPQKLMFGTDWPLNHIGSYLEAFKRAIPPEHWQKVFHDNAVRVFKLRD